MGGIAEFERSLIYEHTAEGRARARTEGRDLGRPYNLTPLQRQEALRLRAEGQDNTAIAQLMGVSRSTIPRIA